MAHKYLELFDVNLPLEDCHAPPYQWYVDQEFYEQEKKEVFERCWLPVGRVDQVAKTGQYFSSDILGNPFVVVRGEDNKIYAHHNVCRHKGAAIADECGILSSGCFTCPYHGWQYHLDGQIQKTPLLGKQASFKPERNGLFPIAITEWENFLFLDLDGLIGGTDNPRDLHKDLEPLKNFLNLQNLRFYERRIYTMNCNWKVFIDNSLDGGYHVGSVHEGLAAGLEFKGYETHIFDRSSAQVCKTNSTDERLGDSVCYAWLFPNLFINRYGRMMDVNIVLPLSPSKCQVIFDFYFDYPDFEDFSAKKKIKSSIEKSHAIQLEDIVLCESTQRGMESMCFKWGRYSSIMEKAVHHFHKLLWREMGRY